MIMNEYNQIPRPTLKTKRAKKHTHILINVHDRHAQYTARTAPFKTGGNSATLIENSSNRDEDST